jgi:PAS domain-containing protein
MSDDFEALSRIGPVLVDGYIVVDGQRRILSANSMYGQMLELKPGDRKKLTSMGCCQLLRLECCKEQCLAKSCMQRNTHLHLHEIRAVTHDNREMTVEISAIPLQNDRGEIAASLIVHRDVTDERRLKKRYMEDQSEFQRERQELLNIIESREKQLREGGGKR